MNDTLTPMPLALEDPTVTLFLPMRVDVTRDAVFACSTCAETIPAFSRVYFLGRTAHPSDGGTLICATCGSIEIERRRDTIRRECGQ